MTGSHPAPDRYPPTARSTPTRHRDRAHYDRATVHAVLDSGYIGHLGYVADGAPVVLPMLYARVGERVYLHGSSGGRPLRAASDPDGLPVCLTVTRVDGLVLARSAAHHSINYRSAAVHGRARAVTDGAEWDRAVDALLDTMLPGRSADARPPNRKEAARTALLGLDLAEVSVKVREGGPNGAPEDVDLPYWSGVVPVLERYGAPVPADDLRDGVGLPAYLAELCGTD